MKIQVGADKRTGAVVTVFCRQKGAEDRYVLETLTAWTEELGHYAVILQSDGEPAAMTLMDAVHSGRTMPSLVRTTAKGSKGSLGVVDAVRFVVEARMRTVLLELEKKLGKKIDTKHILIPWLVRHIGWTFYKVSVEGSWQDSI